MKKQNKTNNQRHESTIDHSFVRSASAFTVWAVGNGEESHFLHVAAETTGDTDENGNQALDFHVSCHFKTDILASGLAKAMERDEDIRQLIIEATRKYCIANIEIKEK